MTPSVQAPAGFTLDTDIQAPAGFTLDKPEATEDKNPKLSDKEQGTLNDLDKTLAKDAPVEPKPAPVINDIPKEYDRLDPRTEKHLKNGELYLTPNTRGTARDIVVKKWNADKHEFEIVNDQAAIDEAKKKAGLPTNRETAATQVKTTTDKEGNLELPTTKDIISQEDQNVYLNQSSVKSKAAYQLTVMEDMAKQPQVMDYMKLRALYDATSDEKAKDEIGAQMKELAEKPFTFTESLKTAEGEQPVNLQQPLLSKIPQFKTIGEAVNYTLQEHDEAKDLYAQYDHNAQELKSIKDEADALPKDDPRGFLFNMVQAMDEHGNAVDKTKQLISASDEQGVNILENYYNQNRLFPEPEPQELPGQVGKFVGGIAAGAAPVIAGSAATTEATGNPVLGGLVGMGYGAVDAAEVQYSNSLQSQYNELREKGIQPDLAYKQAKDYAKISSGIAAGAGAVVSVFLPALKGESQELTQQASTALVKQFFTGLAKNAAVDYATGVSTTMLDNFFKQRFGSDTKIMTGANSQGWLMVAQGTMISTVTGGIPALQKYVGAKEREKVVESVANMTPAQQEQLFALAENTGSDKQAVQDLKADVAKEVEVNQAIPEDLTDKQKAKVKPLVKQKQDVMAKMAADTKGLFPKSHYENQIAELDKKILAAIGEKEEEPKVAVTPKTENKEEKKQVEVKEEQPKVSEKDKKIIEAHRQIDEHIQAAQESYDKAQKARQEYIQKNGYPSGGDAEFDKLVTAKVDAETQLAKLKKAKENLLPLPKPEVNKTAFTKVLGLMDKILAATAEKPFGDPETLMYLDSRFEEMGIDAQTEDFYNPDGTKNKKRIEAIRDEILDARDKANFPEDLNVPESKKEFTHDEKLVEDFKKLQKIKGVKGQNRTIEFIEENPEILELMPELKEKYGDVEKKKTAREKQEADAAYREEVLKLNPTTPREAIMLYFANGGRITSEDFSDHVFNPKRAFKDWQKRIWAHAPKSFKMKSGKLVQVQSIDDLRGQIMEFWESQKGGKLDETKIRNEIISVLNDYQTKDDIFKALRQAHAGKEGEFLDEEAKLAEEERKYNERREEAMKDLPQNDQDEEIEGMLMLGAHGVELSEKENLELQKYLDNFTDKEGNIDWKAVDEDTDDPFSAFNSQLSQTTLNKLYSIIRNGEDQRKINEERGQRKGAANAPNREKVQATKREQLEKEVAEKKATYSEAQSEYEAAKKNLEKDLKNKQVGMGLEDQDKKGKQLGLIDDAGDKAKIVADLKKKADQAQEEYETAQQLLDEEMEGQGDLFKSDDDNIAEGFDELSDIVGGKIKFMRDRDKPSIIRALTKIGKGLMGKTIKGVKVTLDNVIQHIKDLVKERMPDGKLTDDDIDSIAQDITQGIKEAEVEESLKRDQVKQEIEDVLKAQKKSSSLGQKIKNSGVIQSAAQVLKSMVPSQFPGTSLSDDAKAIIRENIGKKEQANAEIEHANKKLMQFWNSVPKAERLGFILSIENPEKYGESNGDFKKLADNYRERLDKVFDMIKDIKDLPYIEEYFPHFWKKPDQAKNFFTEAQGKRPLEGNKSFLKRRFYNDILEGLKGGLQLATENPEEMVRLAEMNAQKFKMAHDIFQDFNDRGLLKYAKAGQQPDGWKKVDDPIFKRLGLFVTKEGDPGLTVGNYYMPEEAAKIVNNYLSPGLLHGVTKAIRSWNNIKNLYQLGMGLFHFTTTTLDTTVTGVGNALQEFTAGNPIRGTQQLLEAMTVAPNLVKTVIRGNKAINDWKLSNIGADTEALIKANGNTGLSRIYATDATYQLQKSFALLRADKDLWQIPNVIKNTAFVLPELVGKPLMEWYVPRLKVGGYLRSLEQEFRLNPNLTEAEKDRVRLQTWDNMDNRLGQVVYDNIFWNKTVKDLAFMAIRSQGWTIGTIKALGGGALDVPESVSRTLQGKGISQRTAWAMALPITVGFVGGLFHYIMTGKKPKDANDLYFPEDGTLNPDGTPHRVSFPSYMKDVEAYYHDIKQALSKGGKISDAFRTIGHKTSPIINEMIEILSNKDFYGTKVYNPDDNIFQKGVDILKYEAHTFEPFSFKQKKGEEKTLLEQFTTQQGLEQKLGLMPAPKEFTRSTTENKIMTAAAEQRGDKSFTPEEQEKNTARLHIRQLLHAGNGWGEIPEDLKKKADIKPQGLHTFITESRLNPYERIFKHLPSEVKLKLYDQMSAEDKEIYKKYLPKPKHQTGKGTEEGSDLPEQEPAPNADEN